MTTKLGKDAEIQGSLTVDGSTSLNDGLTVTGDVNVAGGVTSSAPMNAPSFNQTSDYRSKVDITPIEDGLGIILRLKPNTFLMKAGFNDPIKLVSGLIAHEVQEVIYHPVSGEKDGEQLQRLDYIQLIPYLIRAIQEQQEQIKQLQSKLGSVSKHHVRFK